MRRWAITKRVMANNKGRIAEWLTNPKTRGIDVDSPLLIDTHLEILRGKPLMRGVFREFYALCVDTASRFFEPGGMEVEIGAGISLFKNFFPAVLVTDIKPSPHVDRVLDAQDMDLEAASVRAIYGINCFHHFPEPRRFFRELLRVLKPGGGCVLIEPYYGPFSRFVHSRIHAHEIFDTSPLEWQAKPGTSGPMSGANQALSYLVFVRDREQFLAEFPGLELLEIKPINNYLRYLMSGGLNFRQLLPSFMGPVLSAVEQILRPLNGFLALHHVIVLRKR